MTGKAIAVVNEKGGVGKTTCVVQLAYELAERGKKVCVIDNDPSGDATTAFFGEDTPDAIRLGNSDEAVSNITKLYSAESEFSPLKISERLFLIGATDALSVIKGTDMGSSSDKDADMGLVREFTDSIDMLREQFDFVIIDCPPSFGLLFTSAMLACASGGVLIPMIPDELSLKAAKKVKARIEQINNLLNTNIKIVGVIANKVTNNPMPQSVRHYLDRMVDEFGSLVFKTQIGQTIKISDAIALQEKVSSYAKPNSKAASQLASLAEELSKRLKGG